MRTHNEIYAQVPLIPFGGFKTPSELEVRYRQFGITEDVLFRMVVLRPDGPMFAAKVDWRANAATGIVVCEEDVARWCVVRREQLVALTNNPARLR